MKRQRQKPFQIGTYKEAWGKALVRAAKKADLTVAGYLRKAATEQMRQDRLEPQGGAE